jgi:hypothetical protein
MAPPDEHLGQLGLPPPDWHLGPFGPPPPNEHLGPLGPPLPPPRTYRAHHVRAFLIRQARQARARDQARTECRDLVSDVTRECEEVEAWTPPRNLRRQYANELRPRIAEMRRMLDLRRIPDHARQLLQEIETLRGRMIFAPIGPNLRAGRPRGTPDFLSRAIEEGIREIFRRRGFLLTHRLHL